MPEGDGKTVLVTGGSGYIGGWCIVELLRRGYRVRTTIRNPAREPEVRIAIGSQIDAHEHLSVHQADLLSNQHWGHLTEGCDYVLHVASPLPASQPKDPDELIVPARDGTLRVLGAAFDAGVQRTVLTSSVAAIRGGNEGVGRPLDETDWSNLDASGLTPYVQSKTLAERAAWDLAAERGMRDRLATVNPGVVIGPLLSDDRSTSLQTIERLLNGMPAVPRLGFSFVDVRDVADLQLRAMTAPEAGGERFIAVTEFLWLAEVAEILRERLGEAASKVPTRVAPDLLVRAMAIFDGGIRSFKSSLGKRTDYDTSRSREGLGWSPRPMADSVAEAAQSLLEHRVVKVSAEAA
ncbi:MAG TPA: aldehyde reductase [Solirubrobacterales bacterium]|nr:aldehyde reductase [Solirubrobacterales bacterium]